MNASFNSVSARISHAQHLPAASQLPHDPKRLPLNADVGWHLASCEHITLDRCGHLSLEKKAETARSLTEANGSFGGTILPKHIAYTSDCGVILLDETNALLKKFDPCSCKFQAIPCTGNKGSGPRELDGASAIAICGDNLVVADSGNHRLVIYSLLGFLVRGFWSPPASAITQKWRPVDLAITHDRKVAAADPANGCVHMFNFAGRWLHSINGLGAVEAVAVDSDNRLYVMSGADLPIIVYDLSLDDILQTWHTPTDLSLMSGVFCAQNIETTADGWINLGELCARYNHDLSLEPKPRWFNTLGQSVVAPKPLMKKYSSYGLCFSEALDSRLYRCQWDRLSGLARVPKGSRIKISTFSAESELTPLQIKQLDDSQWRTQPWLLPGGKTSKDEILNEKFNAEFDWDALILSPPGRLFWLKIEMTSDGVDTPNLCQLILDFPRISLRRYLPAVFGEEPNAADFTDRFLAVFDRGFRQIERQVDTMAALFDPLSAPAKSGKGDFLSWLASWIGVSLDRQLPLSSRRNLVKHAGKLFACRGTVTGLRHMLDLILNLPSETICREAQSGNPLQQPNCGPCTNKPPYLWRPPQLILEHFRLRRWLFVGAGRLGDQAVLWGKKIVNRTQLGGGQSDGNGQLGVTQLNTRQDPLRDPFHVYAHTFSVFLPAWVGRLANYKKSVARLIDAEKPAHSQHNIVYVEPRFRVGIQSMIGFDSVIACYPQGVTLGASRLGKASVLSEQEQTDSTMRIGSKSTIGSNLRMK